MFNEKAMQVPKDAKDIKKHLYPVGVKPKYLAGGSFHADLSRGGVARKKYKAAI